MISPFLIPPNNQPCFVIDNYIIFVLKIQANRVIFCIFLLVSKDELTKEDLIIYEDENKRLDRELNAILKIKGMRF